MKAILLDTTVLIDVLRSRGDRRAELAHLAESGIVLATSAVNVAEVYGGMRPGEEAGIHRLLSQLEYYATTRSVARHAGILKSEWSRKGHTLSLTDTLVAATALEYHLALMTDNRRHFPMPELKFHG